MLLIVAKACLVALSVLGFGWNARFRGNSLVSLTLSLIFMLQDWDQINVDFFSNKKDENIPLPEFRLNILWMEKNLAVAIDQVYSRVSVVRDARRRRERVNPQPASMCPTASCSSERLRPQHMQGSRPFAPTAPHHL